MNRVILFGTVAAEPQLRRNANHSSVLNVRVATVESFKDKAGQWQQRTDWHAVALWGERAEILSRTLSEGAQVVVEGSLRTKSYERDGQKHYRTEVNATKLEVASGGATLG